MRAVKLGGSVLTNKRRGGRPTYRGRVAKRLAGEVAAAWKGRPLLVVHGGGAYGHPEALRLGVGKGPVRQARVPEAFDRIQASMEPLRVHVHRSLRDADLPIVAVPASAGAFSSEDGLYWEAEALAAYAERGLVPVTGGDVLLDEQNGLRILSGDEILAHTAAHLGLESVVFATDVDGVRVDGDVVDVLDAVEAERFAARSSGRSDDATGAMGGKLAHAAQIARTGSSVVIVNGDVPGRVESALAGRDVVGTRIEAA